MKINFNEISNEPLANLLRPKSLEEFFGQDELVGKNKILKKLIENDQLHSMIFYGPPGVGKTTLAQIIAEKTKSKFITLSAVTSGVSELRKVIEEAEDFLRLGTKTILFIDEIHRFNKSQQDFLLPYTEKGTIILIGATTENPSFEVNSALLSRSQVFVFKKLNDKALKQILLRAISQVQYLINLDLEIKKDALNFLIKFANGDARNLLNTFEIILKLNDKWPLEIDSIYQILQRKNLRYDKKGEEHYNIISALHKSMRSSDPNAAIYWMMRMLEAGEDPLYIARRLIRFASEDVGMADPHALLVAVATKEACQFNGMPECSVNLAQAVVHLAMAPKSNALYKAVNLSKDLINKTGNLEVPFHLRNASTKLMKEWGYGKNYQYAHDYPENIVTQRHLPEEIKNEKLYIPTSHGLELKIKEKLKEINQKKKKIS